MPRIIFRYSYLFIAIISFLGITHVAHAATPIYRSVAVSVTSALDTGSADSNTLSISGDTATFSIAVPDNVGVGDAIQYDSDNNGSIDSIAFIHGRTSSTVYTVKNAAGANSTSTSAADTDWSIFRAYTALSNGEAGTENTGINATVRNFDTWTSARDLVTADEVWSFAMYGNSGTADASGAIDWVTDSDNYLRLYTPTSTTEVGISQRHAGVFDPNKYKTARQQYGLIVYSRYFRIDGLQLNMLYPASSPTDAAEFHISNNIFDSEALGIAHNGVDFGINMGAVGSISNAKTAYIYNNIFSNITYGMYSSHLGYGAGGPGYVYNNTFYNVSGYGIGGYFGDSGTYLFKNNLFASTTRPFALNVNADAGTDYNATATSSLGYTVTGSGNTHDRVNQTFTFFDVGNDDYHLASGDTGATDVGADLSGDAGWPFSVDMESETRPQGSGWDIGADEYTAGVDVTAPGLSGGSPSGELASNTTEVTLSVTTNENATCKYGTVADTAYASISGTFSTTGGTSHTQSLTGLSAGHSYDYYVRCQDGSANTNDTDYDISFVVADEGIVYANSCSVSDVNIAYAYTEEGDTLRIPAGTCGGWKSTSGLGIYKAITVEGAGRGQTILEIASTTGSYANTVFPITVAATVKSLTITTETVGNSGTAFGASGNGFRITDVEYIERGTSNSGYFLYATAYGLVDHNYISGKFGNTELIFAKGPTDSWQTDNSLGEKDNLFIENNAFSVNGYLTDCNANSRCVVRNNTISDTQKIDGHGKASNSPARGVRHMEVYNNTWSTTTTSWTAIELRGGTGMVFNNRALNTAAGNLVLHEYGATATWPNFSNTLQTYPVDDQIGIGKDPKAAASDPMYLWSNTRAGSNWHINLGYGNETVLRPIITADRDYYTATTTSFDGTSGVGTGVLASRPATCTTGVGYFATDGGTSWNAQNGTSSDGTLYKCTSTNTWTEYYTPYALPHYLTASSTVGTDEVDIGAGARMFGTGVFYDIATSSLSGTYADISVTPGSTTNAWVDVHIQEWQNSGTRLKRWTESMPTLYSTSTYHVIGDLQAGETYSVKVDNVLGASITGPACSGGVCTANGSGEIIFTYSGGYSEHEFEVEQSSPDTTAPVISSVASSTAATTATITFTTDESASSTVQYGTTISYGSASTSATTTSHTYSLTGLTPSTLYHFKVFARDGAGNLASSTDYTFTTTATPDTTAPVISSVASSTGASTATITWTTNEAASSTVNYGATSSYGSASTSATLTTSHSISLTGLTAATTYHFNVGGADASGNVSTSSDYTFTTTAAPDVTAPTLAEVTPVSTPTSDNTPNYTFSSSEAGTISYGGSCSSATTVASVGSNTITFSTLSDGTYSNCTITVTDASANASTPLAVTTFVVDTAVPDTTAPVISSIASSTGLTTATITFTTDESASSTVQYGTTISYGSASTSATTTSHTFNLTGLSQSTLYHFKIFARDAAANTSSSTDYTFLTATPDTTDPILAEVTPIGTSTSATPSYTFTSTEAGTITYGGSCSSGTTVAVSGSNTVTFTSLANGTYSDCTITVTDASSNASDPLAVTTFVVDVAQSSGGGSGRSGSRRGGGGGSSSVATQTSTPSVPSYSTPTTSFSRNLSLGTEGADVVSLQTLLISKGFLVIPPGIAQGYFGALTRDAVVAYQIAHGISPTGTAGPLTQASLTTSATPTTPVFTPAATPSTPPSTTFTRDLELGATGEDVRALQKFLNSNGFILANTGPGSPGNETTKFGDATKYQLMQFQKAKGITPASGYFGPKTRAAIGQ